MPLRMPYFQTLLQKKYKFIIYFQLFELKWVIILSKASADVELSSGTENSIRYELYQLLKKRADNEYIYLPQPFIDNGVDEDAFEDPIEWEEIDTRVDLILQVLKPESYSRRVAAADVAVEMGIIPQLVVSCQLLDNERYIAHVEKLPDLEKHFRQLSTEYRELQKLRPVDISSVPRE